MNESTFVTHEPAEDWQNPHFWWVIASLFDVEPEEWEAFVYQHEKKYGHRPVPADKSTGRLICVHEIHQVQSEGEYGAEILERELAEVVAEYQFQQRCRAFMEYHVSRWETEMKERESSRLAELRRRMYDDMGGKPW